MAKYNNLRNMNVQLMESVKVRVRNHDIDIDRNGNVRELRSVENKGYAQSVLKSYFGVMLRSERALEHVLDRFFRRVGVAERIRRWGAQEDFNGEKKGFCKKGYLWFKMKVMQSDGFGRITWWLFKKFALAFVQLLLVYEAAKLCISLIINLFLIDKWKKLRNERKKLLNLKQN